jgi:hypothetical protein
MFDTVRLQIRRLRLRECSGVDCMVTSKRRLDFDATSFAKPQAARVGALLKLDKLFVRGT